MPHFLAACRTLERKVLLRTVISWCDVHISLCDLSLQKNDLFWHRFLIIINYWLHCVILLALFLHNYTQF